MSTAGRYGVLGAAITVAALIALYYLGRHPLLIPLAFDLRIIVFALFILIAVREYRNDLNKGTLHFWEGLSIGLACYVLIAFIASLTMWLFGGIIEKAFVTDYIQQSMDRLQDNRDVYLQSIEEKRLDAAINALPSTSAGDLAFDYFLKSLPIGFILTLIITLFFRRQPR